MATPSSPDYLQRAWADPASHDVMYISPTYRAGNLVTSLIVVPDQRPAGPYHVLVAPQRAVPYPSLNGFERDFLAAGRDVIEEVMLANGGLRRGVGIGKYGVGELTAHWHVFGRNEQSDGSSMFRPFGERQPVTPEQIAATRAVLHTPTELDGRRVSLDERMVLRLGQVTRRHQLAV